MQKSFLIAFSFVFTVLATSQGWSLQCKNLFDEGTEKPTYEEYAQAQINEAQKADGRLRLNLGGIGEVPNSVNINLLVDPRHLNMKIPNLVLADMREMPFIKNSTVDEMYCRACPGSHDFFDQVITEAHRVLKVGGTFQITSNTSAIPWINTLTKYGFAIERYTDRSVVARKVSAD